MIVVGSCYFLFTLLIPYDPNIDFVFPLINKSRSFDCINRKNNCRRGRVGKIQNNIMVYKGIDLYKHAFNTSSNIHVVFKNTTVTSGHIALSITKNKTS